MIFRVLIIYQWNQTFLKLLKSSLFQTNTVRFLQQHVLNPSSTSEKSENSEEKPYDITDEEINAMIDVLDVNAFEVRGNQFSMRGRVVNFSHSCE